MSLKLHSLANHAYISRHLGEKINSQLLLFVLLVDLLLLRVTPAEFPSFLNFFLGGAEHESSDFFRFIRQPTSSFLPSAELSKNQLTFKYHICYSLHSLFLFYKFVFITKISTRQVFSILQIMHHSSNFANCGIDAVKR